MSTWFKLPSKVQERLTAVQTSPLTCLDGPAINALRDDLSWFRLPEKIEALIAATNEELLGNEYDPGKKLRWFKLEQEVEAWLTHLEGLAGGACL